MNAREIERKAIRKLSKAGSFKTVKGAVNEIAAIDNKTITFTTTKGTANKIKRSKLRKAIAFFAAVKTITRKQLEAFTPFTSAVLGLLSTLNVKITFTASGLVRITLKGIRYIFAGTDRAPRDMSIAAAQGAKHFLMSYYSIKDRNSWRDHVKNNNAVLTLDSGAFSAWKKGITLSVAEYVAFIKANLDVIAAYYTLDVVGDPEATAANTAYMRAAGLDPINVYHVQSDLSVLTGIVAEGKELIGIGGSATMPKAERMEKCAAIFAAFPEENFHLLGGGSAEILEAFAWYSADATTWINARKYCVIVDENGQRKAPEVDALECMALTVKYYLSLDSCAA
jgi:hypothetical protein